VGSEIEAGRNIVRDAEIRLQVKAFEGPKDILDEIHELLEPYAEAILEEVRKRK
jgi:predicted HTH domain antitoxin